jgi:hypothetical protein
MGSGWASDADANNYPVLAESHHGQLQVRTRTAAMAHRVYRPAHAASTPIARSCMLCGRRQRRRGGGFISMSKC